MPELKQSLNDRLGWKEKNFYMTRDFLARQIEVSSLLVWVGQVGGGRGFQVEITLTPRNKIKVNEQGLGSNRPCSLKLDTGIPPNSQDPRGHVA
jgi:hypothetical protein